MADAKLSGEVYKNASSAWHQYLSDLSPLRPALFRLPQAHRQPLGCGRSRAGNLDARFQYPRSGQAEITDPRAYLLRIASNAWIDWQRRKAVEGTAVNQIAAAASRGAELSA